MLYRRSREQQASVRLNAETWREGVSNGRVLGFDSRLSRRVLYFVSIRDCEG